MATSLHENVAAEVRAEMGRNRLSQRQIAAHLGLSQGAIHQRLVGRTQFRLTELDKLARLFDVPVVRLLGRDAA